MKKCKSILLLSLSLVLLSFTLVGCGDNANNNDGSTGTTTQTENNTDSNANNNTSNKNDNNGDGIINITKGELTANGISLGKYCSYLIPASQSGISAISECVVFVKGGYTIK